MPRIKDKRIIQGKLNRDNDIRKYFDKRWNDGIRYEIIEEEAILKFGVSASLIEKILKQRNDDKKKE